MGYCVGVPNIGGGKGGKFQCCGHWLIFGWAHWVGYVRGVLGWFWEGLGGGTAFWSLEIVVANAIG